MNLPNAAYPAGTAAASGALVGNYNNPKVDIVSVQYRHQF